MFLRIFSTTKEHKVRKDIDWALRLFCRTQSVVYASSCGLLCTFVVEKVYATSMERNK